MKVTRAELKELMKRKFLKAGLNEEHSEIISEILTWSDERGFASHGTVRVEYYSERIAKGGINSAPDFRFEKTGPCSGVFYGDNGCGYVASVKAMEHGIQQAKESGISVVGVRNISHSGSIGYYVDMAAQEGLVSIVMCQSDPMAVPTGGSEPYYGTNPIAFGAPTEDGRRINFDMATTVQAWGKVLVARSKGEPIPEGWAVDEDGNPTTDSKKVNALLPISGPKGYGLMMMVDVLSGVMLGLPFGKHVSSMYDDLSKGRDLGQIHIVIDPARFGDRDQFLRNMSQSLDELGAIKPVADSDKVYYPGERANLRRKKFEDNGGIDVVDDIYNYLVSDDVHYNRYDHKNRFAE